MSNDAYVSIRKLPGGFVVDISQGSLIVTSIEKVLEILSAELSVEVALNPPD
jgi:hypothetical protein